MSSPPSDRFLDWWARRQRAGRFRVTRIPFARLEGWGFEAATGNLRHVSGGFFSVEGMRVRSGGAEIWAQPIIHQPEVGILGILVRRFGGVLHCLMQAKMEPGNVNRLQLSPTVQATRSNYTRIHGGARTKYLEYFTGEARGEVLADVLHSEQGSWFWRKRNRNLVVLTTDDVEAHEDFHWLTLPQLRRLMLTANLVNMDSRTVLACLPQWLSDPDDRPAVESPSVSGEVRDWLAAARSRCDWTARLVPLAEVTGWRRGEDEIVDGGGRRFRIVAVAVEAGTREVQRWTQPLLSPFGRAEAVFVARRFGGVLHLLVQARPEYGLVDLVELAPTVQLPPGEDSTALPDSVLRDIVRGRTGTVRYDTVLSEEGGRFYRATTRYRVVEVGSEFPTDRGPDFRWLTVRQLRDLLRHSHYLNIESRSLLACLGSLH